MQGVLVGFAVVASGCGEGFDAGPEGGRDVDVGGVGALLGEVREGDGGGVVE